jgi:hypothetical protein
MLVSMVGTGCGFLSDSAPLSEGFGGALTLALNMLFSAYFDEEACFAIPG